MKEKRFESILKASHNMKEFTSVDNTEGWTKRIAERCGIHYQIEVSDYGTSELIISNELDNGSHELGILIPCRSIHSANSVVDKADIENTQKLMQQLLIEL